jgi:hypothetical protein
MKAPKIVASVLVVATTLTFIILFLNSCSTPNIQTKNDEIAFTIIQIKNLKLEASRSYAAKSLSLDEALFIEDRLNQAIDSAESGNVYQANSIMNSVENFMAGAK